MGADAYAKWIVDNADKRGTPEFETVAQAYKLARQQPQSRPSGAERVAGMGVTRFAIGAADPIIGGVQLAANALGLGDKEFEIPNPFNKEVPLYRSSVNEHVRTLNNQIEAGRGPDAGFDFARLAGNIASPVNAAAAKVLPAATSTIGRVATGAAAGGGGAALMPVTGPDYWGEKGAQVTGGAISGGIATPIIGKIADALAPKVNALIDRFNTSRATANAAKASMQTDEVLRNALKEVGASEADIPPQLMQQIRDQVNTALKSGNRLDAAAILRKQDFEALNMKGTLGQIARNPVQFANERNWRMADERLSTLFNEQSRSLGEKMRGLSSGADEAQVAGQRMVDSLAGLDKQMGKQVTDAYTAARNAAGKDLELPLTGLAQDISSVERNYGKGNAAVRWAKGYLADLGIFGEKQTKIFTVEDAEQALQQINKLRGSDRAVNNALDEISASIKRTVTSLDDQGGVFAAPRNLARQRFSLREMVPALDAAAKGDVSADRFVSNYLLNGETKEVKALAGLLQQTQPELFQQARAQLGQAIMKSAYGNNVAGDAAIKPNALAEALRKYGTEKLGAFFTPQEINQLKTISRVAGYIEQIPAGSAVNTSNTFTAGLPAAAQMIPGAQKLALALNVASNIGNTVGKERGIAAALRGDIPATKELPPDAQRMLAKILLGVGAGSGMGAAASIGN